MPPSLQNLYAPQAFIDGFLTPSASVLTRDLRSHLYIERMKGVRAMRNLIKGVLVRAAIAAVVTAGVSALTGLPAEPEYSIVRSIREGAAATANPLCAPHPTKMPCLQPDGARAAS
jgi:hypothetical protein